MKKKIKLLFFIILGLGLFILFLNNKSTEVKDLYIEIGNEKIYAKLYRPLDKKNVPLVIYSHGLGATHNAGTDYAKKLLEKGIATLTFDFRGGSSKSKSDGKTTDMSILTEVDDLEAIITEVKKWNFIDPDNIILMGSSQGGAVSAYVSSKHDEIKGLVLLYPALTMQNYFKKMYIQIENIPETVRLSSDNITVGRKYFLDIWNLNFYDIIKNDNKKVLVLHGTNDQVVDIEDSRKLKNVYANCTVYEIEGAPHGFNGKYYDEAEKQVLKYLEDLGIINN